VKQNYYFFLVDFFAAFFAGFFAICESPFSKDRHAIHKSDRYAIRWLRD
jgi:hypothetical protein